MKAAAAAMVLASMMMIGYSVLSGDKVRGEKGQGSVNQHWMYSNSYWH